MLAGERQREGGTGVPKRVMRNWSVGAEPKPLFGAKAIRAVYPLGSGVAVSSRCASAQHRCFRLHLHGALRRFARLAGRWEEGVEAKKNRSVPGTSFPIANPARVVESPV